MSDHGHICGRCHKVWRCEAYTLQECKTFGVFKAARVNGQGPFCHNCCRELMAEARAALMFYEREATKKQCPRCVPQNPLPPS